MNVVYVTSEKFTNQLIISIKDLKNDPFRNKYRNADVLIIDDIQFIAKKERVQEEFFHTFNTLYENGKQIIISSDKQPKDIQFLEERLKSRFEWGLLADISNPDYETRVAILHNKAVKLDLKDLPEYAFNYIAENIHSNVRQLEGALNTIRVYLRINNIYLNPNKSEDEEYKTEIMDTIKDALKDLISDNSDNNITPDRILSTVSEHMNVSINDIQSAKRSKDIAIARQTVMYLCRNLTDKSLQSIGESVGGKDHATVYNGIKRIEDKIKNDPTFEASINVIINKLNPQ
jgi:chromosomal replication initiator protein